jgi:hypothetical protein
MSSALLISDIGFRAAPTGLSRGGQDGYPVSISRGLATHPWRRAQVIARFYGDTMGFPLSVPDLN